MIKIDITQMDVETLNDLQLNHPHNVVRTRALILLLKHQDVPHHKIAKITNLSQNTVRAAMQAYKNGGVELLISINFRKPTSKLVPFDDRIGKHFNKNPPTSINHARDEIKKLTGVDLKNTQIRMYLKKLGLSYRKVNCVPAKVNVDAQKNFHDEQLQPKLEEAKKGERVLFFVDAAHFVLGAFLGYLWCFVRIFVRTPCGRQRFNVLGALNAITKELITVTNDTYITSIQVCELLRKLVVSTATPITIVLDNARYQRCRLVMDLAKELGVELLFLPPYSPNLNLIERLWKLTKKECLNSKYYDNFNLFSNAILSFLNAMGKTHKAQLDSLLTLKFQMFSEEQIQKAA